MANQKKFLIPIALLTLVAGISSTRAISSYLRGGTSRAFSRTYICTETGKTFRHEPEKGETLPIYSPYSHKNTGMPGEACYWAADGKIKKEPTWVLLNSEVGKPEPTFCPDCGRLVVGHNPVPKPGDKPSPTREEYYARFAPR